MFKNRKRKGFTLIELIIVIAIIGILIAIAVPRFANSTQKALNTKIEANARIVASGLSSYFAEAGKYPATDDDKQKIVKEAGLNEAVYIISKASVADGVVVNVKEPYTGKAKNAFTTAECNTAANGENTATEVFFKF